MIEILPKEIPTHTLTCGAPGNKRQGLGSIESGDWMYLRKRRT